MSGLCPKRREEPGDMTDYRQGQRSRPMPGLQLFVMGAGKGDVGRKEGQTKRTGLNERNRKERGETPLTLKHTHLFIYFLKSFFFVTQAAV